MYTAMNAKEQTFFFKRLAFLMNANISLVEGLQVLEEQASKKRQIKLVCSLLDDIREGQPLSRACGKFPSIFSEFCISLIKVGESSGTLPQTLEYLAAELKKKQLLRAKVTSAFIYPALIMCATLGITVFLMLYLFPKIMPIFKSLHADLPLSTRMVMGASTFLEQYGLICTIVVVLAAAAIMGALKRSRGLRLVFDRILLRVPLVGGVLQFYNISNTSRTLGLLLKGGVTLPQAVLITADATPNLVYKREFEALGKVVVCGEQISSYVKNRNAYFPPTLCHMVAVGEHSGTLSETLLYMADLYDQSLDELTKNISTLIEPLLMIFMGVLVGFIAVSIITPIYAITQNLHT
jgi:type II secretory pathway component PulF